MTVPVTGGWETFTNVSTTLTGNASGALNLVYVGAAGALFDVDSFTLSTTGTGPIVGLASKCVDVSNGATADGTKIQLYTCNGTASQAWTRNGRTWRALGKCLDISGGGTADGTLVQLWTCNGTAAQNWVPGANSSLINPISGSVSTSLETTPPTAPRFTSGPALAQPTKVGACHETLSSRCPRGCLNPAAARLPGGRGRYPLRRSGLQ